MLLEATKATFDSTNFSVVNVNEVTTINNTRIVIINPFICGARLEEDLDPLMC